MSNPEFEEFWKKVKLPCSPGTWQEVQFKEVALAAFQAAANSQSQDELDKTVQIVVEDIEHYNDDLSQIAMYLHDGTSLSPQEIKDVTAYIITEQVDIDEEIIIRAINFVREKANA